VVEPVVVALAAAQAPTQDVPFPEGAAPIPVSPSSTEAEPTRVFLSPMAAARLEDFPSPDSGPLLLDDRPMMNYQLAPLTVPKT
jgi:hypothetical protein